MSASNVVNLDEIVGTDIEFIFGGETYVFPGDPSTESVFGFIDLYSDLLDAQQKAASAAEGEGGLAGDTTEIKKLLDKVRGGLLEMFRERHPELDELPFGHKSTMLVMQHALRQLGVTVPDAPADPPAPALAKKKATARATSVKSSAKTRATSSRRKR
jgi:hypothetical protein